MSEFRPIRGQSCSITDVQQAKAAALLFDKIFVLGSTELKPLDYNAESFRDRTGIPSEVAFIPDFKLIADDNQGAALLVVLNNEKFIRGEGASSGLNSHMNKIYSEHFARTGVSVVPTYSSENMFDEDYAGEESVAFNAVIQNIPLISDDNAWDTILEIRNDSESLAKVRALRVWLRDSLGKKSLPEAQDIIETKLSDYRWAIRKHGLETTIGTLGDVLSFKGLTPGLLSGIVTGAAVSSPVWGAFTTGVLLTSQVSISIAKKLIAAENITQSNSEVAILHELSSRFKNQQEPNGT